VPSDSNPAVAHAVDVEVIKEKTQVSAETTGFRNSEPFSSDLDI
jgi:hypothetical protein